MAAHDDFQSDKDLPIESGGSDSSSTLLPHPWNYSRKSSRSSWGGQICNYRNWLIALNALIFITTVGLWATGTFARKSEECQCDDSWTTKFEEDCEQKLLLRKSVERNEPADQEFFVSQCNIPAGLLSNLTLISADRRQTRQTRYGNDFLPVSASFHSNLRNRIATDGITY